MSLTAIILLILLGIFLFLVEFLLVPGVTIAGIGGAILIIVGIYFGYKEFGIPQGHYIMLGTGLVSFAVIYFSLRSRTWNKLMLNDTITGRASEDVEERVKIGDKGETITRLNPIGKVFVNEEFYEARSLGAYIDQKTPVMVTKIERNRLVVKPLK